MLGGVCMYEELKQIDPEVAEAIISELQRQEDNIELIASENFVSRAVMAATGSVLTNKYAEGYPGRRYYGGCEHVDTVETLAIDRPRSYFKQSTPMCSPIPAPRPTWQCTRRYRARRQGPGHEPVPWWSLNPRQPVNMSGKWYHFFHYGVDPSTETLDYDQVRDQAKKHRPKLIVAGASAYPRKIDFAPLKEIADEVGAYLMVDMAHIAGLVAAGIHPNPVPYADVVTTTTHKTLRGPRGGMILAKEELAKAIDKAVFPGTQGGPLMHVIAAKAVALKEAMAPEFADYQRQIVANAKQLAASLMEKGFRLVSGGTDTHLMLVDVKAVGLTGKEAESALDQVGITVNKNTIPFDTESPVVTSGIRLGTPAVTTRGMKEREMEEIAELIAQTLRSGKAEGQRAQISQRRRELTARFPIYKF